MLIQVREAAKSLAVNEKVFSRKLKEYGISTQRESGILFMSTEDLALFHKYGNRLIYMKNKETTDEI